MPMKNSIHETAADVEMKRLPVRSRLSREPNIKPLLARTVLSFAEYEAHLILNRDALHPAEAIGELKKQIAECSDMQAVADLQARIAALSSASAEVRSKACDIANQVYEPCRSNVLALAGAGLKVLEDYQIEADTAEALFFDQFGLRREGTSVSSRVHGTRKALEEIVSTITNPSALGSVSFNPLPPRHPILVRRQPGDPTPKPKIRCPTRISPA
jgi:hypothetical protein